jgi:hypothetical protein
MREYRSETKKFIKQFLVGSIMVFTLIAGPLLIAIPFSMSDSFIDDNLLAGEIAFIKALYVLLGILALTISGACYAWLNSEN